MTARETPTTGNARSYCWTTGTTLSRAPKHARTIVRVQNSGWPVHDDGMRMCLVFQLTGGCSSSCRNRDSHRQPTPGEQHRVGVWKDTWCGPCGPAGCPSPPPHYTPPPVYQPYQPAYPVAYPQYAAQQQFDPAPPAPPYAQGGQGGRQRTHRWTRTRTAAVVLRFRCGAVTSPAGSLECSAPARAATGGAAARSHTTASVRRSTLATTSTIGPTAQGTGRGVWLGIIGPPPSRRGCV